MARLVFILGFIVFSNVIFSQNNDSLKLVISISKQDSSVFKAYRQLIDGLLDAENYKEAANYNQKFYEFGVTKKYPKAIAYHHGYRSLLHEADHQFMQSIDASIKAIHVFDSLKMQKQIGLAYRRIGDDYYELANYNKAVEFIFREIKIEEALGEKQLLSGAYLNLGNVYRVMEDYAHAEMYYLKSFDIKSEIKDSMGIANCYNNLGLIYRKKNDYKKALVIYHKSLTIYENLKNTKGIIRSYTNIGVAYKYLKNYSNAMIYFKQAFNLARKNNKQSYLANLYNNIAQLHIIQNQPNNAIPLLDSSVVISTRENSIEDLYTAHEYLSKAYNLTKNFEKAYKNHVLYKHLHDSIYNDENSKAISDLRTQFEVEKKEIEVKAVSEAEQKKLKDLAEVQKTKGIIIIVAVAFLLCVTVVFLWILFKRFSITNRQKEIIEKQKEILSEKQGEIIDSITYAKRLQLAILPSLSRLKKYLPNSFVLYKPKDIVAGDFYWLHHITEGNKEIVFVAAADSTGHGVPGAMVSVVCSNALNRAVKEFGMLNTGEILDKTRELVLETFSKSGDEIKDGMDISLCKLVFDKDEKQTVSGQWSGANNSLWYAHLLSNNVYDMKSIKADKQSIGFVEDFKPYQTHHLDLKKGEVIYLLTDGFADQFGGDKGKKFKSKPLSDLLLSCAHLNTDEQEKVISTAFETWKGNLDQVDDVTIIAIRI